MSSNNNELVVKNNKKELGPIQGVLDIGVEITRDVNGIEMGVLDNGTPFLSQRGLSVLCGIENAHIGFLSKEWNEERNNSDLRKKRLLFVKERLEEQGYYEDNLYIETKKDGRTIYAYPDIVCMAILEYYSFEASDAKEDALRNYRNLARYSLREFIYKATGYTGRIDPWKYFHDRVSLVKNAVPNGYFSIFNEIGGLFVDMIEAGIIITDKVIPDISVGQNWGKYWVDSGCCNRYNKRISYLHNYPDYYPQSKSNPQEPWAYPLEVIPEFREWFKGVYIRTKFPKYLLDRVGRLPENKDKITKLLENLKLPMLENK